MQPILPNDTARDLCVSIFRRSALGESVVPASIEPLLKPMADIRGVLFDVYGTLFSSSSGDIGVAQEQSKTDCFRQSLSQIGCSADPRLIEASFFRAIKETHNTHRARGAEYPEVRIEEIWRSILAEHACVDSLDQFVCLKAAVEYESCANPVAPMPGARRTIDHLAGKCEILGIVSNAQIFTRYLFDAYLGSSIEELGIPESNCAWSYEIGEAKPSTRIFLPLLGMINKKFGIEPQNLLYVGNDMLNDVSTAEACECRTALFAGDARSLRMRQRHPECVALEPDIILTRLEQLESVI